MLLGLVLLIWGVIGFKVLDKLSSEPQNVVMVQDMEFTTKKVALKDTFSIIAAYRDPFLGILSNSSKKPRTKKKPEVQFPNIVYTGLITDQKTKKHIFFVTISGRQYLMQKGNINDGIILVYGNPEYIKLRYMDILKTVPLQNAVQ